MYQLKCRNKIINLARPQVMGIINLSEHSYSDVGKALTLEDVVAQAKKLAQQGAAIIDIGAEPTNPVSNNAVVTAEQEMQRLLPAIKAIVAAVDIPISVDTSRPEIMEATITAGAHLINDVRALREPGALKMAAKLQVPVCLMHMRYYRAPDDSTLNTNVPVNGNDVLTEIREFLQERIDACLTAGIKKENIVLDPGIGAGCFGKTAMENIMLISHIEQLHQLNYPLLAGASRKLFIGELDNNAPPAARLGGSIAAALALAQKNVHIIRVHDVADTVQALKISHLIQGE